MKYIKTTIICLVIITIAYLFFIFILKPKHINFQPSISNKNTEERANWLLYENKSLGISLNYPEKINNTNLVFFQVGDVVFITTEISNIYVHRDEIKNGDVDLIIHEYWNLKNKYSSLEDRSWAIWVSSLKSENDLGDIIHKWFGDIHNLKDGCKFSKKYPILNQDGYYDIEIESLRPNDSIFESSCPVNWIGRFIYSSNYNRVAIWDIGQEGQFYTYGCADSNDENKCYADFRMAKSFRFIDKN